MKLNGSGLRRADWTLLLEVYVDRHRHTPFEWGVHDCVQFATGWVEMVREDLTPRDDLSGLMSYSSAAEAVRIMGRGSLTDLVESWGELARIQPAFAQRGDLVLVQLSDRECLALCVGDHAAGPGPTGLELAPMPLATAAWRV
jgi:hypothetical protein